MVKIDGKAFSQTVFEKIKEPLEKEKQRRSEQKKKISLR